MATWRACRNVSLPGAGGLQHAHDLPSLRLPGEPKRCAATRVRSVRVRTALEQTQHLRRIAIPRGQNPRSIASDIDGLRRGRPVRRQQQPNLASARGLQINHLQPLLPLFPASPRHTYDTVSLASCLGRSASTRRCRSRDGFAIRATAQSEHGRGRALDPRRARPETLMPLPIVVPDASVILKWVLRSDSEPDSDRALHLRTAIAEERVHALVPSLWHGAFRHTPHSGFLP